MTISRILDRLKDPGSTFFQGKNRIRLVLIAAMIFLIIAAAVRSLTGYYDHYAMDIQSRIDTKLIRYESLGRLLADSEKYQQEHLVLSEFQSGYLDSGLIRASTHALAEAQLQNLVNDLARESNLNILSMRMHPRTQQGDITNLRIGISSRGEIGAIKDFLLKASNHEKFIFVDQTEIRILNQRERRLFNFNAQLVAWQGQL